MQKATEGPTPGFASTDSAPPATRAEARRSRTRLTRRWALVAGATAVAVVVGGGAVAYTTVHKTVQLDVDGTVTTVSTFAGSVEGLLSEQGVEPAKRDLVEPGLETALRGDTTIVVRSARHMTVQVDGVESKLWLTDLDADEALTTLAERGEKVELVATPSPDGGHPSLPVQLDADEPISLVVGGEATTVPDGARSVAAILAAADVELNEADRVRVRRDTPGEAAGTKDAGVALVVHRVTVEDVTTTTPLPFETITEQDASRFSDLDPKITQVGAEGVQTAVNRVTTVDGVVESTEPLSDETTLAPVNQIVVQGTKVRPAPAPAAPKTPAPAKAPAASAAQAAPAAPAAPAGGGAAPAGVWASLAQCESGGNPAAVSKNGKYHGLYQFSVATWKSVGGTGLPSQASAEEQTMRAQALQQRSGWGQWPHCSSKLGLR